MVSSMWCRFIKPPWPVHYPLTHFEPQRMQGSNRKRRWRRNSCAGNP